MQCVLADEVVLESDDLLWGFHSICVISQTNCSKRAVVVSFLMPNQSRFKASGSDTTHPYAGCGSPLSPQGSQLINSDLETNMCLDLREQAISKAGFLCPVWKGPAGIPGTIFSQSRTGSVKAQSRELCDQRAPSVFKLDLCPEPSCQC